MDAPASHVQAWPVVGWRDIVHAFRPDRPAREAPLKTLRTNAIVSQGIRFTRHTSHRLAGAGTLYSRLNVSAAVLHRRRETGAALAYRAQAQRIEEELMSVLKHRRLETSELEFLASPSQCAWEVLHDLCKDTQTALASLPAVPEEEYIAGILRSTDGRKVRFTESGPGGVDHELPYAILRSASLSIGDPAVLVSEFTGASVITRLQPGVLMYTPEQGAKASGRATVDSDPRVG